MSQRLGGESGALVITAIGVTYMDSGDWEKVAEFLAKAEETVFQQAEKRWGDRLECELALARLMEHQGQRDNALKHLLEAAEIESQTFGSTGTELVQGQNWRVYNRLFALLLEPPPTGTSQQTTGPRMEDKLAFRFLEQLKYRTFRNFIVQLSDSTVASQAPSGKEKAAIARIERASKRLRTQESSTITQELKHAYSDYEDLVLQSQLDRSRYELVREARAAELEEVQKALDSETALIEYLFAADQVYALVITRSMLRGFKLPVTKVNLAAKVRLLRALVFSDSEAEPAHISQVHNTDWQPVAKDLSQRLIEPLEQSGVLKGIRRLGIVPFSVLRDLPFAALARSANAQPRFLIEDYSIFYAPSASFLTRETRQAACEPTILSLGRNESGEDGLTPLEFAADEALNVAQILNGEARVNAAASETGLKELAPRFKYIHLATHSVAEPMMPLLSRLKLEGTGEDDGNLTVREVLDLDLRAELVPLGPAERRRVFPQAAMSWLMLIE